MASIEDIFEIFKVVKEDFKKLFLKLPKMKKVKTKVILTEKNYNNNPNTIIQPSITKSNNNNDLITRTFLELIKRENAQFIHCDNSSPALTGTTYSTPPISGTYVSKIDIKRRIKNSTKIASNILEELP